MTNLSRWTLVIFIISALTYGIIEWRTSDQESPHAIDGQVTPDFIAEVLKTSIYDKNGKLSHEIEASRMEHYAQLELTHFEWPHYTLYPKNNSAPWQVEAKEATLYKNNRVILRNNVLITATEEHSLIQRIQCKYLELDLNTEIISSNQDIVIYGKDFTMYGAGLIIDLNTTQMTLTKHVQTIYQKPNS